MAELHIEEPHPGAPAPCRSPFPSGEKDKLFLDIPESGFTLFLRERTTTIHFIRHAQGYHNEANRKAGSNMPTIFSTKGSMQYWDARLSPVGRQQCLDVRKALEKKRQDQRFARPIQLVVVSPLSRALETASLIFGPAGAPGAPPFIVHELCRERYGLYTCDGRRKISEIKKDFPDCIDFVTAVESDKDSLWTEERESSESCSARGIEFLKWLAARPENEVAVVTHSSWLRHLFTQFGDNMVPEDKETLQRLAGNAEIRSVVLCDHNIY